MFLTLKLRKKRKIEGRLETVDEMVEFYSDALEKNKSNRSRQAVEFAINAEHRLRELKFEQTQLKKKLLDS